MNRAIELHDSELGEVMLREGEVVVTLSPAMVHRSAGRPGVDGGTVWLQWATLTFAGNAVVEGAFAGGKISDGSLRIGVTVYDNSTPAEGNYEGTVEFSLLLCTGEAVVIRGDRLTIELQGEGSFLESFEV